MKRKGKIFKTAKLVLSFILISAAVFCICRRFPECFKSQDPAALAAAAFTLTDGTYKISSQEKSEKATEQTPFAEKQLPTQVSQENSTAPQKRDKSDYYDSFANHDDEAKFEIAEKTYGEDGTKVDLCYLKNKTGLDLDFEKILKDKLTFDVKENTDLPQVLIYHTHTTEGYMDEDVDYFYDSFYSRTQDENFSVVSVGDAICNELNKRGIKAIHDKTIHDSTYNGSYDRSVQTVESNMDKYKDIKVVIDIHRDAIGTDECKIKPVFTYNGQKAAQIMIMSGCDTDGEMGFTSWQNNLNFALKIQNKAEQLYPGMTRPIDFGYFAYNEYVCDGSLLIEVGTEANSVDEATRSGALLGNVLYEVLK